MDINKAKTLLSEERDRLQGMVRDLDEDPENGTQQDSTSELSTYDQHPADQGTETFEREKNRAIKDHLEAQLVDVQRAFTAVEDGSYGKCEVCGAEIDDERLEARPMTRYCVEHQKEVEQGLHAESRVENP